MTHSTQVHRVSGRASLAYHFARLSHGDQLRKTGEPYITHPVAVAEAVWEDGHGEEAVVVALLHDVVEDTPATLDDIGRLFTYRITQAVDALTKRPGAETYDEFVTRALNDPLARVVKAADIRHNLSTLPPELESLRPRYELALKRLG